MIFTIEKIEQLKAQLANSKKIVIIGHKGPDGDSLGSCLGLKSLLVEQDVQVEVIAPDAFPEFLNWMQGANEVCIADRALHTAQKMIKSADLIFTLDFNHEGRVGKDLSNDLLNSKAFKVMVDHHRDPSDYCDIVFSDISACSTAQMIYELSQASGWMDYMTKDAAEMLYCGIMTDTGSFKFPSTTSTTHRIIASLIDIGANHSKIHSSIYDSNSIHRVKLLGYTLNKMEVHESEKLALFDLSIEELERFNYKKGDTEGFVNYALSMNGIEIAAFFKETPGLVKISFRSTGDWHVNELARDHFNGGGHKNAAGGASELSLTETIKKFKDLFPNLIQYHHA